MSFEKERDRELVSAAAAKLGWPLPAQALEALVRFVEHVDTENARTNLTGAREPSALVDVLLADAFVLAERSCIPDGARVVDVGAGAGAPALPLAILRPDLDLTLVEPRRLRVAFIRAAIGELGLERRARVEERKLGPSPLPGAPFDVAFSRATFEPAAWLERGLPLAPRLLVLTGADPLPQKKKLAKLVTTRAYTLPGAGSPRQLGVYERSGTRA